MAPASPSTVMAVPDRPSAERPETKEADGADGQFAGLMAHFVQPQPQAPVRVDGPPAERLPKVEQEPKAPPPDIQSEASQGPPAGPGKPVPRSESAEVKVEEASAPRTGASTPTSPARPLETESPRTTMGSMAPRPDLIAPGVSTLVEPVSLGARPRQATAAPLGTLPAPLPSEGSTATSGGQTPTVPQTTSQLQLKPAPAGQIPIPTTATTPEPPTGSESSSPVSATAKVAETPLVAFPRLATEGITVSAGVRPSFTPPTKVEPTAPAPVLPSIQLLVTTQAMAGSAPTQPEPKATPQIEPGQSPVTVLAQAVLAESSRPMKQLPNSDAPGIPPVALKAEQPAPVERGAKFAEGPRAGLAPAQTPLKAPMQASPLVVEAEASSGVAAPAAQSQGPVEPAPPTVEDLVAKATPAAMNPVLRGPDGSSMAVLNTPLRAGESAPVQAPAAATPPPAAPPTAPVVQVEGGMRWMLKGGAQEAQLQLHPEALGQVTIHLKVEGGEVHARLWVTEPASVKAVMEGRPHLEQSLKEQGLQLGSFDLQQGHRPFQEAPAATPFRERFTPEAIPARQEAPAAAAVSILNAHHVELYA